MNEKVEAFEVNFDGLVGPTHHYGGLAPGNLASAASQQQVSNPKQAALQGLSKMKALHDRGFKQGVLPPHERPAIRYLRSLGFSGSDQAVVAKAAKYHSGLLSQLCSASNMWVANAATVSPSADTLDSRVHFTPGNLNASFHRSIEAPFTATVLRRIFADKARFAHHDPLPAVSLFADEGAANHTRFCSAYGSAGVEFFVYGRSELTGNSRRPTNFPARQTLEASEAIARLHGLASERVVYGQQTPEAIDAGVFHNDVIAVGNGHVLFYHEKAFVGSEQVVANITSQLDGNFLPICVLSEQVSLQEAVTSYLFNSQLLSLADGSMLLVVPGECQEVIAVKQYLNNLVQDDNPINEVISFDLKQSMKNGGGPACLRLRVVLNEEELLSVNPGVLMTDTLYGDLTSWVERHYRDRLTVNDLQDPQFLREVRTALDELSQLLKLSALYDFQTV